MNELAVVICNFNKKSFVLDCIESVFRSDFKDLDLIVVDNASTDDSVEAIRERFGDKLTLLVNEVNTGGSGGFNRGIQEVLDRGIHKYVMLADNDITVEANTIDELKSYMDSHPETGVCGATIFQMGNREITQEMGANISFEGFTNNPLYHQVRKHELPPKLECDYVAFCASIIRVDAIRKAGLIESDYFIYWDDMEFCWRTRKSGYKVSAISSAIVYHHTSPPSNRTTFTEYYFFRNKTNCFARHLSDEEFALLPEIITKRIYRIMVCNKDNYALATTYMHALDDALNAVVGKAQDYKIFELPKEKKWHNVVKGKSRILIEFSPDYTKINLLLSQLREFCDAEITIATHGANMANYCLGDTILVEKKHPDDHFDVTITVCHHVLDFHYTDFDFTEGRTLIIDSYGNSIVDKNDLLVYQYHEENYSVFRAMLYNYIKDKLRLLREDYLNR